MTWKKALLRGLLGAPIGVTIGYAITILISLIVGNESFSPVVPAFQEAVGTQTQAVAVQFILLCLMGFLFALASCIWEVERWSLTRQTVLHFLTITLATLPIAWACRWADHLPGGILGYFGIFFLIYLLIWVSVSLSVRRKIRSANAKLMQREKDR